jgi:S-adenosylhomocysteine hydrolase
MPFRGKTFLIVLHFLKDLIILLELFEKLGLEPDKSYLFWKPYLYPHKDEISSYLKKEKRYNVYPLGDLERVLGKQQESMENIVVLEDGGYIVPLLHRRFKNLLEKTVGAVEQTTKGIWNDNKLPNIAIPILNVAEAEIKQRIEPPFVADAAVQNIKNLLSFETLRGKRIALLGYGVIGSKIVEGLRSMGTMTVYDPNPMRRVEAQNNGCSPEREPYNAVKDKFLVIGCSGETSIARREILSLKHEAYLVSTSSDQMEINIPVLGDLSKAEKQPLKNPNNNNIIGSSYVIRGSDIEVRLLADGYPVNFWCSESMPNQVSDLILSVIFLSAFELVVNKKEYPKGFQNVDEIVRRYEIAEIYEDHYHE